MLNSIIASIRSTAEMFAELGIEFNYSALAISTLVSSILFLVIGYAFRSVGVYVMSKKQGLSTPWLSFVPFLGYVQLGKLIGPASICGIKMKNPVTVASGTFGYGREYSQFFDLSEIRRNYHKGNFAKTA